MWSYRKVIHNKWIMYISMLIQTITVITGMHVWRDHDKRKFLLSKIAKMQYETPMCEAML